jgi:2-desacetyl-2-hydroxyethyl bacteriochlorophyllide A dehydrogenase
MAAWFPQARRVELREEELPPVGADQVRILTLASGISHGTEMLVYRGQVPADLNLDLPTLQGSFAFPIKYGYAGVGKVVETGSRVSGVQTGDLVFTHHPHQTAFVVPASMPVVLPRGIDPVLGVFFANVETAVNVLLDAHPHLGDRVAIFGQGVVGLLIAQLARRTGVSSVVTADSIERRRDLSLRCGADAALAPGKDVADRVADALGGAKADVVIEASGNPAALAQALDCVGQEGTVVVCSWYGTKPAQVPLGGAFHRGRISIVSSQVGSIAPRLRGRWNMRRRAALAADLLPQLQLAPLITQRVPFERAGEAYDLVDRYPEETVQVVLTYGEEDV